MGKYYVEGAPLRRVLRSHVTRANGDSDEQCKGGASRELTPALVV